MKRQSPVVFDFEIDKLTNSIENVITGDSFDTIISIITIAENKLLRKEDWIFDWKKELKNSAKSVYQLAITGNSNIIQGLISIEDKADHIFMHLIESAKFNKGKKKVYYGVPGNLVAYPVNYLKKKVTAELYRFLQKQD